MSRRLLALALFATIACSAPATPRDLAVAEADERAGRTEHALVGYRRAQKSCAHEKNLQRQTIICQMAWLHHAELLDRLGRRRQAVAAYQAIPQALPDNRVAGAEANYRAGKILLELGDDKPAYTHLWRTVTDYPEESFAGDALKIVVRDGRRRAPNQLAAQLTRLLVALSETAVADNLLYSLADISEHELADAGRALELYTRLSSRYPKSGLHDDSLWHGARLARAQQQPALATSKLKALLATREVAFGAGSYFSIWLDDAQLELGRVLRDDLGNGRDALAAFRRLPDDYPASILRDDALFEEALTLRSLGRDNEACRTLKRLRTSWPDSKYELEKAPALRKDIGCRPGDQP